MSQSQQSTFSSIYDNEIDNLSYIPYDNPHIFTLDLSESQQTIESIDPEFLRTPWLLYACWPWSKKVIRSLRRDVPQWLGGLLARNWLREEEQDTLGFEALVRGLEQFHQTANSSDGAPKIMCKHCGQILEHPYTIREERMGKNNHRERQFINT